MNSKTLSLLYIHGLCLKKKKKSKNEIFPEQLSFLLQFKSWKKNRKRTCAAVLHFKIN